ncbi:MAG: ThiF family adenylyltransferase [Terracidiphilus sp.]|jgi:molybdopterin/thiamine biosynthesis adenylyltransferase
MGALHIVVAGAGNIGSHLLPHLARIPAIKRITLVDPDTYEESSNSAAIESNLATQNIERSDLGRSKVEVQAEKLHSIRPDLDVVPLQARIEDVPRGLLVCSLFTGCLDSRLARQHLNEISWRLNTPWIDCGILGSQNLARVTTYRPNHDSPCLECSWNPGPDGEYALLEQEYLCGAGAISFSSMASSALGALAASLAALQVAKFVRDAAPGDFGGRQLMVDSEHHTMRLTAEYRNSRCRFDHRVWHLEPWVCSVGSTTIGDALRALGCLRVEGQRFARGLVCPGCGRRDDALRMNRPLARCSTCNLRMTPADFGYFDHLDQANAADFLDLTLSSTGVRAGDIVSSYGRHRVLKEAA